MHPNTTVKEYSLATHDTKQHINVLNFIYYQCFQANNRNVYEIGGHVLFESLSRKLFPNVNYNTFIVLMPDHICTILLEGSEDASYEENTSIFDEVFKYIDSTQRFSTFEDMFDTSTDN